MNTARNENTARNARPANDNVEAKAKAAKPLPIIDPTKWQGVPVKDREWFVPGMIPARNVTLLSGDGGTGKSQLALQLIASSALRCDWLGLPVANGPAIFFTAEDEADELHRRLACIVAHHGKRLADLTGVRLIPMVTHDPLLSIPNQGGQMTATPTFVQLCAAAGALRPKLIVLDTSADVFGGDEIKRAQVRQFVAKLRELAVAIDCAVLLLSHPSLTGISTGTGLSGSTAWNNSVRSRLYLTADNDDDPDARTLRVQKIQYARKGAAMPLCWDDGVFVLDSGPDPAVAGVVNSAIDSLFLELLALFTDQGQNVGTATGTTYAPARMAAHPKAKGYGKRQLAAAMQRLLDAKAIKIETYGPPSKQRRRLVVVAMSQD